jgi:hypothetical protein
MIKEGEIVYANLIFRNKKGVKIKVCNQIFSRDYNGSYRKVYTKELDAGKIKSFGLKEDSLTLIDIEVIKSLGFKN